MLIHVKIIKKKSFYKTDGQTDTRSTQNYSSEPPKKFFLVFSYGFKYQYWFFFLFFKFILKSISKNVKIFFVL
jgi:hypothetical protein